MFKILCKRAGSGYTANCISLGNKSYAVYDKNLLIFNFGYTGGELEITLSAGKYKLQCWGAQGGDSPKYNAIGSKGGYSEGVLTLTETTKLYICVGGKGSDCSGIASLGADSAWNGGYGCASGVYEATVDSQEGLLCYPAGGGGATDIATVAGNWKYDIYAGGYVRSSDSALSRCIVAGGGAGASSYYNSVTGASGRSKSRQYGGGRYGGGTGGGTQKTGGSFGKVGEIPGYVNNQAFIGGGPGGGWYTGSIEYDSTDPDVINQSGGGSGFVNIAANSSSRPSGYTGLQLDSGTTTAGNYSFISPTGGYETGHSGNGYARITTLELSDGGSGGGGTGGGTGGSASITWETQSGTWNKSTNSSAADNKQFTCLSPGSNGSTVLRCTFSGISSIKFKCRYQGESNYDYLTVGSIDTPCTRSSYKTSLKGTTGTWKEITYTCDSGEHYVEFCYSKDSSVDNSPDNAEVYISAYS